MAGAALVAVAALTAAPASAQTVTTHDAAHDVLSQNALSQGPPTRPAPHHRNGDALWLRVVHGPHRIRLTLHFARLTRPHRPAVEVLALATNAGKRAELDLVTLRRGGSIHRTWQVNGHDRRCPGLRSSVKYHQATVRAVIPRSCLGDPRWVRAGGGDGTLGGHRLFADDVSLNSRVHNNVALGARAHHS
jgi:hypothetical protein